MKRICILALTALLPLSAATLTLEECYREALANSLILKRNTLSHSQKENALSNARADFFDVTAKFNGSYTYGKDFPSTSPSPAGGNQDQKFNNLSSSAGLEARADLSLGLIDNYKYASLALSGSSLEENQSRLDLLASVTGSFYELAAAKDALAMQKEKIELSRLQYEQEKLKLQLGNSTRSELFAAEVEYSADSLAIFKAETEVSLKKQALLSDINRNENYLNFDIRLDQTGLDNYDKMSATLEELIAQALENHAEYKTAKNSLEMQKITRGKAVHSYFPSAYAAAGVDYAHRNDFESEVSSSTPGYSLSLGLNWSISLLGNSNALEQAELQYRQEELELESKANEITRKIKSAYLNVQMQEQQLLQSRKHLELTRQNLELAEEMYRLGKKSLIEMVSAKNSYIGAKTQSISARYEYKIAYSTLMNAIGK